MSAKIMNATTHAVGMVFNIILIFILIAIFTDYNIFLKDLSSAIAIVIGLAISKFVYHIFFKKVL